jgi:hypothetical protein
VQVVGWTMAAPPAMSAILSIAHTHLPLSVMTTLSFVTVGCGSSIKRGCMMGMENFQSLAFSSLVMICTPVAPPPKLAMMVTNQCAVGASYTTWLSEISPAGGCDGILKVWSSLPSRVKKLMVHCVAVAKKVLPAATSGSAVLRQGESNSVRAVARHRQGGGGADLTGRGRGRRRHGHRRGAWASASAWAQEA